MKPAPSLLDRAEALRHSVARQTPRTRKGELGQFMTPAAIARFMAEQFLPTPGPVTLLDPGAGLGALTTAVVDRWRSGALTPALLPAKKSVPLAPLSALLFELDAPILAHLKDVLSQEQAPGHSALNFALKAEDFLEWAAQAHEQDAPRTITHAILNPPYKKMGVQSTPRHQARRFGLETVNLYAAFVGAALDRLAPEGQLVAIIPRSFCSGPYYRPFRAFLLARAWVRGVHLFDARDQAFAEDGVLQENVIVHLQRPPAGPIAQDPPDVRLSRSTDATFQDVQVHQVPWSQVCLPQDPDQVIRLPMPSAQSRPARFTFGPSALDHWTDRLASLGLDVSTGPVVDFRVKTALRPKAQADAVPLVYPAHCQGWEVAWPLRSLKKPNALARVPATQKLLWPMGDYLLVRRFSPKEEPRRVVPTRVHAGQFPAGQAQLAFENHLNVIHARRAGLDPVLAWGLLVYLASQPVDAYVRLVNGHTQVNATDLRTLPMPPRATLLAWGRWAQKQPADVLTLEAMDAKVEMALRKILTKPKRLS